MAGEFGAFLSVLFKMNADGAQRQWARYLGEFNRLRTLTWNHTPVRTLFLRCSY